MIPLFDTPPKFTQGLLYGQHRIAVCPQTKRPVPLHKALLGQSSYVFQDSLPKGEGRIPRTAFGPFLFGPFLFGAPCLSACFQPQGF